MLIGLHGYAQSGKDTVFTLIQKLQPHETVQRMAFADPLKKSVAALLDISVAAVEKLKTNNNKHLRFTDSKTNAPLGPMVPQTMRSILQRYGTEAHRDILGEDFWVDCTLPRDFNDYGRVMCVTDVRYRNEADRIHYLGGFMVEVKRGQESDKHIAHRSERGLPTSYIDYAIMNMGDLEDLEKNVMSMLDTFAKLGASHDGV